MAEYQQIRAPDGSISSTVLRRVDSATIPDDPANRDRQQFDAWVAEGNTPDPPDALPPITTIASFDFLSRFTRDEQLEMQNAAASDATIGAGLTNLSTSDQTDLEGTSVSNWLDALIVEQVITAERKAELLAPPETPTTGGVWR